MTMGACVLCERIAPVYYVNQNAVAHLIGKESNYLIARRLTAGRFR